MSKINLSAVLSEVNRPNAVFNLTYRKENGECGEKKGCILRRSGDNALNERKKMNRSGKLKLLRKSDGHQFEVFIDFLLTFNGQPINHFN
ncbi:hypothetical protein P1X15_07140 [Runella sp. MFBS21]|uniref:hypothetical protein n=1 Tax=Runella sp. MFBS21 TaxID=3034018 RepID=UPI0023F7245F|nr:hypothetical protein [Runella sp. MFBS21]MDF7817361.1 hypothetical protein [Runella sp. MFBS21]